MISRLEQSIRSAPDLGIPDQTIDRVKSLLASGRIRLNENIDLDEFSDREIALSIHFLLVDVSRKETAAYLRQLGQDMRDGNESAIRMVGEAAMERTRAVEKAKRKS